MARSSRKVYGFFGHHKCASTWFEDIFRMVAAELRLSLAVVYSEKDFGGDLARFIDDRGIDFICYANAHYDQVAPINNLVGFHVVRDPRDIIVSAYFSHLNTHPTESWEELVPYKKMLKGCSQHEGLLHEIEFRSAQFAEMSSWLQKTRASIREVRMEDVTARPYEMILSLTEHLGLLDKSHFGAVNRLRYLASKLSRRVERKTGMPMPRVIKELPTERLLGIVWENEFAKKAGGREPGQESIDSHYRKGMHGDWKNYLTEDHLKVIKERYNDLIVRLGYEADASW